MPTINNSHYKHQITFQLDLEKTDGFIYDINQKDYYNWIPCNIKINVENEVITFSNLPKISLEGIKYLFKVFNQVLEQEESDNDKTLFQDDFL